VFERLQLLSRAPHGCKGAKLRFTDHLCCVVAIPEDLALDFGREAQEAHDLADAGAGDAFAAADGGLAFDLASIELALPFTGAALDWRGFLGGFGSAALRRRLAHQRGA